MGLIPHMNSGEGREALPGIERYNSGVQRSLLVHRKVLMWFSHRIKGVHKRWWLENSKGLRAFLSRHASFGQQDKQALTLPTQA